MSQSALSLRVVPHFRHQGGIIENPLTDCVDIEENAELNLLIRIQATKKIHLFSANSVSNSNKTGYSPGGVSRFACG